MPTHIHTHTQFQIENCIDLMSVDNITGYMDGCTIYKWSDFKWIFRHFRNNPASLPLPPSLSLLFIFFIQSQHPSISPIFGSKLFFPQIAKAVATAETLLLPLLCCCLHVQNSTHCRLFLVDSWIKKITISKMWNSHTI